MSDEADYAEQDALIEAAEGNRWLEDAGVVAWSELLLALRANGWEFRRINQDQAREESER
jgi:hypothetical protein